MFRSGGHRPGGTALDHLYELDGLRALAVLTVILSHSGLHDTVGGWMGVDVFFVLSGYLITTILLREYQRNSTLRLGRFYLKRFLRLYPALLLLYVVGFAFYRYLGNRGTFRGYLTTVELGATYVQNLALGLTGQPYGQLGHTWSLATEEQFYLVWAPLLLLTLRYRWATVATLVAGTTGSLLSLFLTTHPNPLTGLPNTYYRPDTRCNELFLGCLLAILLDRIGPCLQRWAVVGWILGPLCLGGLVELEVYACYHSRQLYFPQEELAAGLLSVGLVGGLCMAGSDAVLNRVLRVRPLVWLGTISYGMYIFMIPVLILLPHFAPSLASHTRMIILDEIVVIVVVAATSYYLVERRFLALKDRLTARTFGVGPLHSRSDSGRLARVGEAERGRAAVLSPLPRLPDQ